MNDSQPGPPKYALRFFRWFCRPEMVEDIEGDLVEKFQKSLERHRTRKAEIEFILQVFMLFRIGIIRQPALFSQFNPLGMWRHNILISWRNLKKNLGFALLNITGLSVGLACTMLIALFVKFELSYDTFHDKHERIFRVVKEDPGNFYLGTNKFAVTPAPLPKALMEEFPEVEAATQIRRLEALFQSEKNPFYEKGIYATNHFFDIFTFPSILSDAVPLLTEPNTIVLTSTLSEKYFNSENPLGKVIPIRIGNKAIDIEVVGVVEDVPTNSHLDFDFIISMATKGDFAVNATNWDNSNYLTYALLESNHNHAEFADKLSDLAREKLSGISYYRDNPDKISNYYPQALGDIHLHSHLNFEFGVNGHIKYVRIFSAIALLILLIACVNFINLSTSRLILRRQEVSMRKIIGADRHQLVGQLLGETILPALSATILALTLVAIFLPMLNQLTNREIHLGLLMNGGMSFLFILSGVGIGLLAGLYPAIQISNFKSILVSRSWQMSRSKVRNALVVLQFAITVPMIISTLVIHQQLEYIKSKDNGIDRDHILAVKMRTREFIDKMPVIKQSLIRERSILGVSASGHLPTLIRSQSGMSKWEGSKGNQSIPVYHMGVEYDFADLVDIDLINGRNILPIKEGVDKVEILINQTLANQAGWSDPIGKEMQINGRIGNVVGLVQDFNFLSLHQKMAPLALYSENKYLPNLLIKIEPQDIHKTISLIERKVQPFSADSPFEYEFLDTAHDRMYAHEIKLGSLFKYFTVLALFVACLGLLGLAAFLASQRTKEIGVRKVLGCSIAGILRLLSYDFTKLVASSFIIAFPIAWYAMNYWLSSFAFHVDLHWWFFAFSGLLVLVIALLAVSSFSIRAATLDPVKALKND